MDRNITSVLWIPVFLKKRTLHELENDHYYTSRASYFKEAITEIGNIAAIIYADNKAKVKVGNSTLAISRQHRIRSVHLNSDVSNYNQHDFPTPEYLITKAGYLMLEPKVPSAIEQPSIPRQQTTKKRLCSQQEDVSILINTARL